MRYAVLDWDNTLRKGYTLFSWTDFLCKSGLISFDIKVREADLSRQYLLGQISHDEYARSACEDYALALKDKSEKEIENAANDYWEYDKLQLFGFTHDLFCLLHQNDIKPIIISGAPKCIIEKYKKHFFLHEILAVEPEYIRNKYTGKIKCNYGYNKENTMLQLKAKLGDSPILAFGDSSSDVPLFKSARHSFCIYDKVPLQLAEGTIAISQNSDGIMLNKLISKLLSSDLF